MKRLPRLFVVAKKHYCLQGKYQVAVYERIKDNNGYLLWRIRKGYDWTNTLTAARRVGVEYARLMKIGYIEDVSDGEYLTSAHRNRMVLYDRPQPATACKRKKKIKL